MVKYDRTKISQEARMKKVLWKTTALLVALALSASLASGKPKKSGKNSAKVSGKAAAALKTATEDFVRIEAGTFMMGTVDIEWNEAHSVTLTRTFYICDHEVTNAEYEVVMGKPSHLASKGENVPVVYVTWYNAIDYCNKLSELQGLTPCYTKVKGKVTCDFTANGYRLPTEAEWERAARAGNDTTESLTWNGITEDSSMDKETKKSLLDAYAWLAFNSEEKLHPVKEKKPNAWGLYDMIGNVCEWCWDWDDSIGGDPAIDPTGPASIPSQSPWRILRGGDAFDPGLSVIDVADSLRGSEDPQKARGNRFGFRVVRTADD
jgi:formylglycine-generating enzyme required for sulfatase activity